MSLFKLRGELSKSQSLVLGIIGMVLFLAFWWIIAEVNSVQNPILKDFDTTIKSSIGVDPVVHQQYLDSLKKATDLAYANATEFEKVYPVIPSPLETFKSYGALMDKDNGNLAENTWISIWLNIRGYFWAILISIPIGFVLGLIPLFRGLFSKQVDALRYLPLTALVGVFMGWFGLTSFMKIAFLAFGIIVYLLPVVVQRINEVKDVYLKTVFTLGATDWQTIKSVYIPSVMSKLMDDIRVLTAISWTYIIIAELLNNKGGLGALIYTNSRQGKIERVFAVLIIFIVIGFIQDRIFVFIDKRMFPHKYSSTNPTGLKESQYGIMLILGATLLVIILQIFLPNAGWLMSSLLPILVIGGLLFICLGEYKIYQNKASNA